jgi:hypothetical protein
MASKAALHFGTGLVNFQRASAQLGAIQGGDRLASLAGIAHFHEREAPRPAGFTVGDYTDFLHIAVGSKQSSQFFLGRTVGQVANKKILHLAFSNESGSVAVASAAAKVSSRNKIGTDAVSEMRVLSG